MIHESVTSIQTNSYDELVRRRMSTRVAAKATGYSQDTPMLEVDKALVEKATATYELNSYGATEMSNISYNIASISS